MTSRAPFDPSPADRDAGLTGLDPDALELSLDAATAFAHVIARDRAAQETAQFIRRAAGADRVVVALTDGDDPDTLEVAAHLGFEEAAGLRERLADDWRRLVESWSVVRSVTESGATITHPLHAGRVLLGAVTVFVEGLDVEASDVERVIAITAPHAAAAVARANAVRRAEQRNRLDAAGETAAGLAHELRNPLFGISSAAQLLRFRVTEDPVVEKNVGRVLREVERLNAMVTALLEYGRPAPLRLEAADPDAIWDAVLDQERGRLESKALQVARTRSPQPGRCSIDRGQIAQVFTNLLDNAIDAAPEGTDLTLHSSVLSGGAWRMRLANGGFASPEVLARAFDLFYSTKPGGTGVGLPLCQRIVEEHGGTVALESSRVSGTASVVTLPARAAAD